MKSTTRIYISIRLVLIILLPILGIGCIMKGLRMEGKARRAVPLEQLTENMCAGKPYVSGYITSYVVNDRNEGISYHASKGRNPGGYAIYTVPVADGKYICIGVDVEDQDKLAALEKLSRGVSAHPETEGVYFEGEVIDAIIGYRGWYKEVAIFQGENWHNLIGTYQVRQLRFAVWKEWVIGGAILLVLAFLLYKSLGGKSGVVAYIPQEKPPKVKKMIYDYDSEIQAEKLRLQALEKRLLGLKKSSMRRVPVVLIGLAIMLFDHWMEDKLAGFLLLLAAAPGIVRYWRESSGSLAQKSMGLQGKENLYSQIENSKRRIAKLNEEADAE
ncbi:MAG: hypothetical protein IJ794_19435 [Lachnospiraceae bacterium]|nr:hypothetical protein [Lachnospiraceae bacterium]